MSLEYNIIKLLLNKDNYNKYINNIYKINTEKEIKRIIYIIDKYYKEYKEHVYLTVDELRSYFFLEYPTEKNTNTYDHIFDRLHQLEVSDSVAGAIVQQYVEQDAATRLLEVVVPIIEGETRGGILDVLPIIDEYRISAAHVEEEESYFVEDGIGDLIELADKEAGLKWRSKCLNDNIGPLVGGSLGHILANPEVGKTSALVNELTYFAGQTDEPILGIFNEEDGKRIRFRLYQSMLNISGPELVAMVKAGRKDELDERYNEMGGSNIRIYYDPSVTFEQIARLTDATRPRILAVDIADHVMFHGAADLRTDLRLEGIYRRYRQLAGTYDCLDVITCAQAGADADGKRYVKLSDTSNSKVGKPGALDWAISIGKTYNENESDLRWFNIVKNKVGQTIQESNAMRFDKLRGRYEDV